MDTAASWFARPTTLTAVDALIVLGFVVVTLAIGALFGKDEQTTDDFFVGGRRVPGWAACLSFVATEISALTIISVPATAFKENWNYAQFFIGSAAARIVIAYLFIPAFFALRCTTIYEYVLHRFGPASHRACACFFFVTRLLASGVRLMAAAAAVGLLVGWHIVPTIVAYTLVTIAFIGFGGIKAVVWNNVIQALTFMVGGALTVAFLSHQVQGGLAGAWQVASAAGKLEFIHAPPAWGSADFFFRWFSDPNIVVIAVLNGFVGSMAAFGTDHDLMQRLLTVRTRQVAQRTLVWTIAGSLATLLIYLTVGSLLSVLHGQEMLPHPGAKRLDEVFPHFIAHGMPEGMRALMLTAIVLASIDSPLASLSASFVTDVYRPLLGKAMGERHYVWVSRLAVAVFGLVLGVLAYVFSLMQDWLWLAFKIGGVTFGSLLGVFLLGLLTRHRGDRANVVAMVASAAVMAVLLVLSEAKIVPLGWTWLIILGTTSTMGIAYALADRLDRPA